MRQSIRHHAGTDEAQSPPSMLADVEIDRVRLVLEMSVLAPARVPRLFQLAQRADDAIGGIDGVRARAHLAHMDRMAAHLDLEPEHADIGAHDRLLGRLGDQRGIGLVAAQMRHQRAVAGRLLLDHRLDVDGRGGLQADAAQRVEREDVRRSARLHVGAAAAIHPVAVDSRLEGRLAPHVLRSGRHDVDVRLQDQRAAVLLARPMDADDDRRVGVLRREPRAAGVALDRGAVHGEAVHRVAARAQRAEHVVLQRVLLPAVRRETGRGPA